MNIDMTRHQGATGISVAECIDKRFNTWRVRTDFQPAYDEDEQHQEGVTFIETEYPYKPSMDEVKDFVYAVINAKTDEKILCGYEWTVLHGADAGKTVKVWLSDENKENYKAKYDTAKNDPELITWPCKFKVAENADRTPVYEYFDNLAELKAFYYGGLNYIEQTVNAGWAEKDGFDFTPYEELFPDTKTAEV